MLGDSYELRFELDPELECSRELPKKSGNIFALRVEIHS